MAMLPPRQNPALSIGNYPAWTLLGPGLATVVGLAMWTGVYRIDGSSPIQVEFGMSGPVFFLIGFVAYLIAAALAFSLGYLLGGRALTAVSISAAGVMLLGVVLVVLGGGSGILLVGRVLGGLGAGAAAGVTTALVRSLRSRRDLAAVAAAAGIVALVIAPIINQLISDAFSFRLAYLTATPLLVAALLASVISGIALAASNRPGPNSAPYPPPGFHP
ncbi:hypothetical protein [Nocardia goodfellowii]|uniref:MFS family permease n=1 Tax=Nocardia goodfellowii TaxID=882446 RepID=A0ABS4QNB3_9NOCA|nr:hypothetical protein [Nocardia goodfellowii]MBP2193202.1 MFS family permease [Nocardia goodfellowii]